MGFVTDAMRPICKIVSILGEKCQKALNVLKIVCLLMKNCIMTGPKIMFFEVYYRESRNLNVYTLFNLKTRTFRAPYFQIGNILGAEIAQLVGMSK